MRVKVRRIGDAMHPSEVVVQVKTIAGNENLVVDKRSIQHDSLAIGAPIARRGENWLVELPRETMQGAWRVWVKRNALTEDAEEARVA
ncbi:MAG TPA: hypothetical protein VHY79_05320 [Rhizomicrobium sp.]|jgi:hypothetical protein|nr:hypothetical protein [Rhizomicrobium sp.]